MVVADEGRVHAGFHVESVALGNGQKFERIAQLLSAADIFGLYLSNALHIHVLKRHAPVEGQTGQNAELVSSIQPLDVAGGIRFGQAQALGVGQHVCILGTFLAHAGKDVVGGAVDDAVDIADAVGLQAFLQRMDDGDGSTHRRLVIQARAALLGGFLQFMPVQGEGYLVGRDHGFAAFQRQGDPLMSGLLAAQKLQYDGDFRIVQHVLHAVGQYPLWKVDITLFCKRAHQHPLDGKAKARAVRDVVGKAIEQLPHAPAHVAAAQKADGNGSLHGSIILSRVSGCVHRSGAAP